MRPGRLYFVGEIGAAQAHSHHAVQLLFACDADFVLRDVAGEQIACRAAVVPANTEHVLVTSVADGLLVLVDPASALGRRLGRGPHAEDWRLDTGRLDPAVVAAAFGLVDPVAAAESLAWAITGDRLDPVAVIHPAVIAAEVVVRQRLPAPIRLSDVAKTVHLSPDRLAHLFKEQLGVPFRPYVRWERLRLAFAALAAGRSLTEAAHGAGFADSSHISRTFRGMFGMAPSEAARDVRWLD